jgi:radical SAM superfamily enzyme YgiQ (UPF0313 family)
MEAAYSERRDLMKSRINSVMFYPQSLVLGRPSLAFATLRGFLNERGYSNLMTAPYTAREHPLRNRILFTLNNWTSSRLPIQVAKHRNIEDIHHPMIQSIEPESINPAAVLRDLKQVRKILEMKPRIVGISVPHSYEDILCSIALSKVAKQSNKKCFVVWGGPLVSMAVEEMMTIRGIQELVDGFVLGDGEAPLAELIHQFSNERDLSRVPNLIFNENGSYRKSKITYRCLDDMNTIPDFGGARFKWLPIRVSFGCPWARCTYCNYGSMNSIYRVLDAGSTLNMIKRLKKRHKTRGFLLRADSLTPGFLKDFSKQVIADGIRIRWGCFIPISSEMDEETIGIMSRAGCCYAALGVETASKRVLELMNKPHRSEDVVPLLRRLVKFKIRTCVQIIFGFPGETRSDVIQTLKFLSRYKELFSEATPVSFSLQRNTPIHDNPERFEILINEDGLDWRMGLRFTSLNDPNPEQARRALRMARQILKSKHKQFIM